MSFRRGGCLHGQQPTETRGAGRKETGIGGGDAIEVELTLDTEPRTVEPPGDLAAALAAAPGAAEAFAALPPSRQKAHVTSIEGAKARETRERRIAKTVAELTP
ncbi:YdeI/OmpD-associated family protein [Streptomyces sp. st115]|uniref:YdeI/OmpD-associated family protein n=1 Tax=Streptomyces sp. st115 TaxID=1828047 RepID=UPI00211D9871|nr:YdeI/OmpD-associated family protein [Streptomyces sp. st115]